MKRCLNLDTLWFLYGLTLYRCMSCSIGDPCSIIIPLSLKDGVYRSRLYFGPSAFVYFRTPITWLLSLSQILRDLNGWRELVWHRLSHKLSRDLRALLELLEKRGTTWEEIPLYAYKSLGRREIRLLSIKRRTPFSGLIKAEVSVFDLGNAPPYEAISYTWGDPSRSHEISTEGCRFHVTSNLYSLLHARSSFLRDRLIWVDFISINQADNSEKERQIPMMADIYRQASRVVIWLGDVAEAPMAADMINKVYCSTLIWNSSLGYVYNSVSLDAHLPRWHALTNLFDPQYFSRIWICQEVAVASDVQIYHGGIYIPWKCFMLVHSVCQAPQMRVLYNMKGIKEASMNQMDLFQNSFTWIFSGFENRKKFPFPSEPSSQCLQP
jgi:hypothetical protein